MTSLICSFLYLSCSTKPFKRRWVWCEGKHLRGKWKESSDITYFQTALVFLVGWPSPAAKHLPSLLLTSSLEEWGENRRKVKRQVNQDSDSLIGKAKALQSSKVRNTFTTSHQQARAQLLPGKQGLSTLNTCLGRQTPSVHVSPSSSFPWAFLLRKAFCPPCVWKWFLVFVAPSAFQGMRWVSLVCSCMDPPSWREDYICILLVVRNLLWLLWCCRDNWEWDLSVTRGSSFSTHGCIASGLMVLGISSLFNVH